MKKKVHLLPNVITAFGLSCGLFVIFRLNMAPPGGVNFHTLLVSTGILILAAFADLLDGALARAIDAESEFGGFFDSLADAVTFGVAPSVVVIKAFSPDIGEPLSVPLIAGAMIYSLSGVLRLVRFNVVNFASGEVPKSNYFTGLPIPAAGACAVSLTLFFQSLNEIEIWDQGKMIIAIALALVALGYLMISRLKFPSLKTLHIRVASFHTLFFFVVVALAIFYGVLYHFPVLFLIFSWGYVGLSLILSLIRWVSGQRLKQLADFDPEPDEIEWTDD